MFSKCLWKEGKKRRREGGPNKYIIGFQILESSLKKKKTRKGFPLSKQYQKKSLYYYFSERHTFIFLLKTMKMLDPTHVPTLNECAT